MTTTGDESADPAAEFATALKDQPTYKRVYQTVIQLSEPTQVDPIANRADVAADTARKYIRFFVELGILREDSSDPLTVARNESYFEWRSNERLRTEYTSDELAARLQTLQETVKEYQEEYDADHPTTVDPTVNGYEQVEETLDDLRSWDAAESEIETIIEVLRREHELPTGSPQRSTTNLNAQLRSIQQQLADLGSNLAVASTATAAQVWDTDHLQVIPEAVTRDQLSQPFVGTGRSQVGTTEPASLSDE